MAKRWIGIQLGLIIKYRIQNLSYLIVYGGTLQRNINGHIKGL